MKNMKKRAKAWALAAGGWGMAALADEGGAQAQKTKDPDDGTKGKPPAVAEDPDYAVVRKFLRGRGIASWDGLGREREGSPEAGLPPEVERSLVRLAERSPQGRQIWESMRGFLQWTPMRARRGNLENLMETEKKTRSMISDEERVVRSGAAWQMRARTLMDLAREGRLAEDVYQAARKSMEEELHKSLAQVAGPLEKDESARKEAARRILELLEPDLKDPETLPEPLRMRIAGLIVQLGDRDFEKREEASQDLVAIGERALGSLRRALEHPDPEVAVRARDAWEKILGGGRGRAGTPARRE